LFPITWVSIITCYKRYTGTDKLVIIGINFIP